MAAVPNWIQHQHELMGKFLCDLLADLAETYKIPYQDLCNRYVKASIGMDSLIKDPKARSERTCSGYLKTGEKCMHKCLPGTYLCKRHQYQTYNIPEKEVSSSCE